MAQIITFGTLAARAAIKDTGRVLDMPYNEVDRIAKMIPGTPGMTIDKAMADVAAFQDVYTNDPAIRNLVDTAKKLEGMVRNSGVHASAVVISPVPLDELVPLYKTKNDEIVTAYDMKAVEKMGLLKMDFLGLTTLTIIDDCLKLIRATRGETVVMETIPMEDTETYEKVFHKGQTSGVFQFESDGMRDVLRRYQPASLEDLTALNALYRPGPIQGGMIDDFIERKWGRKKVDSMLPELERLLKETLGVIVYQEQVMQIANVIAGYSLGEADLLRRAMGKKNAAEMDQQRERFMQGAAERRFSTEKAGHIFDLMAEFAGYGFNKSHSAAYALVAYHTAYLSSRSASLSCRRSRHLAHRCGHRARWRTHVLRTLRYVARGRRGLRIHPRLHGFARQLPIRLDRHLPHPLRRCRRHQFYIRHLFRPTHTAACWCRAALMGRWCSYRTHRSALDIEFVRCPSGR